MKNIDKIADIPMKIIHGTHDMNCLFLNAWNLHKARFNSELFRVEMGAHVASGSATIDAQVRAADELKKQL